MFTMGHRVWAAAVLVLVAALAQASARDLQLKWGSVIDQHGRQLQQVRSLNCTKVHPHCAACRNQRGTGTGSELVCSSCESGYRLRRDGTSKTCGELQ
jgi:hypothetical protein